MTDTTQRHDPEPYDPPTSETFHRRESSDHLTIEGRLARLEAITARIDALQIQVNALSRSRNDAEGHE